MTETPRVQAARTARMPVASEALVAERAKRLVSDGAAKVLVLRAQPRWRGPSELAVGGARVLVRAAVSQLAALDALAERGPEDYLVLLSDQNETDLGDAVLVRAEHQRIEPLDEWGAVPALYGAHHVDPALRRLGAWVPAALLDHQPPAGWPRVSAGVVGVDYALGNLLGALLHRDLPVRLDLVGLLDALEDPSARGSWQATSAELRNSLGAWAATSLGKAAELMLAAAARGPLSPTAIGLVLDVLWPDDAVGAPDPEQAVARGRIETRLNDRPVPPDAAREYARAARTLLVRLDENGAAAVSPILTQAEALLEDLRWAAGAERSTVLPSGLRARYRALAARLHTDSTTALTAALPDVEGALRDVVVHERADRDPGLVAARMAVRLARWLARQADDPARTLGEALQRYLHDGAWVDHAAAVVWDGAVDDVVAGAYRSLWAKVREVRDGQDAVAASLLAEATARDETPPGAVLIERVLQDVVWPVATTLRPLVILLDGMSGPVAVELAEGILRSGTWRELVQEDTGRRLPVLAALPTLTRYSRASFFAGELVDGNQSTETPALRARFQAPLFHKDDMRSDAGDALPAKVRAAIADEGTRMVGVVLNTIDDALAKHDPGGTRWGVTDIRYLPALLAAAAEAGRSVVLTSDHGHVVERGSEVRSTAGQTEARWREASDGGAGDGEVLLRGRRVVPGGDVVMAWREDLRYTSLRSGYHGGASLAEITVPLLVLARPGQKAPAGWREAPPQAPVWWNEAQRVVEPGPRRRQRAARTETELKRAPAAAAGPAVDGQGTLGFDVPTSATDSVGDVAGLADALAASPTYERQRRRAGRRALDHEKVATVLDVLTRGGGRAHRDTLAAALSIPASSWPATLAALNRLLNVEGYPVVRTEGEVVVLDEDTLRDQFEIGGARG